MTIPPRLPSDFAEPQGGAAGMGAALSMRRDWGRLRSLRARLVLSGHEYNLQRFRRRDGLTQYVAGAGGSVTSGFRRDRRLAFGRGGVTGGLRIALEPGVARLEFHTAGGRILDRSRVTYRRDQS